MKSLKEIYKKFNSESSKIGGDKGTVHSYIDEYYETALAPYRELKNVILEIGIHRGHSLMLWKEYFINSEIIGVDLKIPNIDIDCRMIKGDATASVTFDDINELDIVIDDGSHCIDHQLLTFSLLFPKLNTGGIYIIEDIANIDETKDQFLKLHPSVEIFDFRNIKNRSDDVIVQIKK